jgi:DNA-binding beta-propeller fold protein YncE
VIVGREPKRLAFGVGSVWVPIGAQQAVARVDPRTLKVDVIRGVGDYPAAVSADKSGIWVADAGGDQVIRIDPRSRAVSVPIHVGDEPSDIAVGEAYVWTANGACTGPKNRRYSVSRIDLQTQRETRIRAPGRPLGIGTGGGSVCVANADGTVRRIDPRAAQLVGPPIHVGGYATDVAIDATGIWVAVEGDGSVVRIDPDTLRPGQPVAVRALPHTLAPRRRFSLDLFR